MKKPLFFFLFLIPFVLKAQLEGSDGFSNQSDISGGGMFRSYDNRFKGIEGHPMMFEQFLPGRIYMSSGKAVDQPQVNVDIHVGELIVKREGKEVQVMKAMVKKISLLQEDDSIHLVKIPALGKGEFYQQLISNKANLYKRKVKVIKEANHTGAYSSGKTYSQFEEAEKFYWSKENGALVEIQSKKTFVPEINNAFGVDVSEFMKKAKINLKKTEDLYKVFNYLNSKI